MSCTKTALIVLTHCFSLSLLNIKTLQKSCWVSVLKRLVPQSGVLTVPVQNFLDSDMGQHTTYSYGHTNNIMVLWSIWYSWKFNKKMPHAITMRPSPFQEKYSGICYQNIKWILLKALLIILFAVPIEVTIYFATIIKLD